MKKVWLVATAVALVLTSLVAYMVVNKSETNKSVSSFSYCGCGGCGGEEPVIKVIEDEDQFNKLKRELIKPSDSACATRGCSICTEYRLVSS